MGMASGGSRYQDRGGIPLYGKSEKKENGREPYTSCALSHGGFYLRLLLRFLCTVCILVFCVLRRRTGFMLASRVCMSVDLVAGDQMSSDQPYD